MIGSTPYPKPTDQIPLEVVEGAWIDINEVQVQAVADKIGATADVRAQTRAGVESDNNQFGEAWAGDGGSAARAAMGQRAAAYGVNADFSATAQAEIGQVAGDVSVGKSQMNQIATSVEARYIARRAIAAVLGNWAVFADTEADIAEGKRLCQNINHTIRDKATAALAKLHDHPANQRQPASDTGPASPVQSTGDAQRVSHLTGNTLSDSNATHTGDTGGRGSKLKAMAKGGSDGSSADDKKPSDTTPRAVNTHDHHGGEDGHRPENGQEGAAQRGSQLASHQGGFDGAAPSGQATQPASAPFGQALTTPAAGSGTAPTSASPIAAMTMPPFAAGGPFKQDSRTGAGSPQGAPFSGTASATQWSAPAAPVQQPPLQGGQPPASPQPRAATPAPDLRAARPDPPAASVSQLRDAQPVVPHAETQQSVPSAATFHEAGAGTVAMGATAPVGGTAVAGGFGHVPSMPYAPSSGVQYVAPTGLPSKLAWAEGTTTADGAVTSADVFEGAVNAGTALLAGIGAQLWASGPDHQYALLTMVDVDSMDLHWFLVGTTGLTSLPEGVSVPREVRPALHADSPPELVKLAGMWADPGWSGLWFAYEQIRESGGNRQLAVLLSQHPINPALDARLRYVNEAAQPQGVRLTSKPEETGQGAVLCVPVSTRHVDPATAMPPLVPTGAHRLTWAAPASAQLLAEAEAASVDLKPLLRSLALEAVEVTRVSRSRPVANGAAGLAYRDEQITPEQEFALAEDIRGLEHAARLARTEEPPAGMWSPDVAVAQQARALFDQARAKAFQNHLPAHRQASAERALFAYLRWTPERHPVTAREVCYEYLQAVEDTEDLAARIAAVQQKEPAP